MVDEFEKVRHEVDAVKQARDATSLLNLYQQRGYELARLRREAINRAAQESGATYADLAKLVGISKARVTQLRQSGPPSERGFFGVGPIDVAVPIREIPGRPAGGVAAEDAEAQRIVTELLTRLSFDVRLVTVPSGRPSQAARDAVVISGPKSSPTSAELIDQDPHLEFAEWRGKWYIAERESDTIFSSPLDQGVEGSDIAYVSRRANSGHTTVLIAGVHALGSVGAANYLAENLPEIHQKVGSADFSLVISSSFVGLEPNATEAIWGPKIHR